VLKGAFKVFLIMSIARFCRLSETNLSLLLFISVIVVETAPYQGNVCCRNPLGNPEPEPDITELYHGKLAV
jgi:hypothetical protein